MVDILPVTLLGNTLGERHHCLNAVVDKADQQNVSLQTILEVPEVIPIDRVFKIKLASKHKHVDFIVENLKNKDMLYVSLALKNMWLLAPEYSYIINPEYLESILYPEMITPAVNKMKNFIELKLKNPERCQEFYEYYKSDFDVAIKFLWHCPKDFIAEEVSEILDKLTPKHLKILCEACPQVARVYFEGLQNNTVALNRYLSNQQRYFNSISKVLKTDGNLFLDLTERYFNKNNLHTLSPSATKYIMKNFKNRYLSKPELYAAWLLDVKTLSKFLSSEEIKDIVIKLARAEYLNISFTYKYVEPFLKCLAVEERALIKKQVFVDKSFGPIIETWPYPAPEGLLFHSESDDEPFADVEHEPYEYRDIDCRYDMSFMNCAMKRSCHIGYAMCDSMMRPESDMVQLFERYRFKNFDQTFFEFRKLLLTEGTIEGRRNMMLVLVSKAGGNKVKLEQLLKFLVERHSNEPSHLRDAVVRSMVKRAFIWRLPSVTWDILLKWATTSVPEILHSSIIRHLLAGSSIPTTDIKAYLDEFCDLTSYSLNAAEKTIIAERLPALLISVDAPKQLLDTLEAYKLRVNAIPGAVDLLISAARKNEDILRCLFKSRVARKYLLPETFKITQTDAAYVNALKHDLSVLANGQSFATLVSKEKPNHDRFLRALVLYFSESGGLAVQHRVALEKGINEECNDSFARPLAFLYNVGSEYFKDYIEKMAIKTLVDSHRKFAAAVRANAFVVRPPVDIDVTDWHAIGAKFICNKVLLCSKKDLDTNIQKCLEWKKTMRVAFRLAARTKSTSVVFAVVARTKPTVALKLVLSDIHKRSVDIQLWNQVKPIILNLDFSKQSLKYIKKSLGDLYLKTDIEADYWTTVYAAFRRISELEAMPMLCKIESLLTEVDQDSLKQIISKFLDENLNKDGIATYKSNVLCLYIRIIAKYLITNESDHIQKIKMETVCDPFFNKIEILWQESEDDSKIIECIDDFLLALKCSCAFLNTKYVSCMPIFEIILERLRKFLPRQRYFEKYVFIHLTMLYYRSIKQAMNQKPEIFETKALKREEGVKLVGFILGKYIGTEIQDLVQNWFKSVIEIYQRGLVKFVSNYFEYNESRAKLVMSMIRGLLEGGAEAQLLAQHVFEKEHSGYVNDKERDEVLKLLKEVNNEEMKFFLFADIYRY